MDERIPDGFQRIESPSRIIVVRSDMAADMRAATDAMTLYDFARSRPDVRAFRGRGDAYAFRAPESATTVLVRHSRHGGMLAPVTGDLFLRPGRAAHELNTSHALSSRGVSTAEVLGYASYIVASAFCRTDVMMRFIPGARDLATLLLDEKDVRTRAAALDMTRRLLTAMADARALHPDLNLRNILISDGGDGAGAWVLDVDRVVLDSMTPAQVADANLRRLLRSAAKISGIAGRPMLSAEENSALRSGGNSGA
jgi:3-deoxy-D-manno-octulosonic acid kinase